MLGEGGSAASTCQMGCGNGMVDHELGEDCDDSTACCVGCRRVAGVPCNDVCYDTQGNMLPSSTPCSTTDGVAGQCVDGVCTDTCTQYINAEFGPPNFNCGDPPCRVRCEKKTEGSGCYSFAGTASYLPTGTVCEASGEAGQCGADAQCITGATCGNGEIEIGEDCDDTSAACHTGLEPQSSEFRERAHRLAGPRQVCYSHGWASPWTVL